LEQGTIDVEIRARQGGEKFKIDFPRGQKSEISAFMEQTMKQPMAYGKR
jgi:hypothetical protein